MANELNGKRVAILAADGVERVELEQPRHALDRAGVVSGRTLTSFPSIRTDLRNAGAQVVDEEVARDGNLVTSRSPDDLPAFCDTIVELFAGSSAEEAARS